MAQPPQNADSKAPSEEYYKLYYFNARGKSLHIVSLF